jgi:hypothetical protein
VRFAATRRQKVEIVIAASDESVDAGTDKYGYRHHELL